MKTRKLPLVLALLVLFLPILACGGSFSTANISDAWMANDEAGNNHTTVFSQSDVFYAFINLQNAPDDTQLKAVWTAVNVEGEQPNTQITETDYTSGDGVIHFQLTNDQLWPAGSYKVEIYLNGTLDKTLAFQVQ